MYKRLFHNSVPTELKEINFFYGNYSLSQSYVEANKLKQMQ